MRGTGARKPTSVTGAAAAASGEGGSHRPCHVHICHRPSPHRPCLPPQHSTGPTGARASNQVLRGEEQAWHQGLGLHAARGGER